MSTTRNGMDRRSFLRISATGALAALPIEPAFGGAVEPPIKPIELPETLFGTQIAGISRKTHEEHYEIYRSYVAAANDLLPRLGVGAAQANPHYSEFRETKVAYARTIGAVRLHELYFTSIGGKVNEPANELADAITASFGSYEGWKADMRATGLASRGWAWLAVELNTGRLVNHLAESEAEFPNGGPSVVLALDMAEHAYYLDFDRDRPKYLDAYFQVIDWSAVDAAFRAARVAGDAIRLGR